MKPLRIVLIVLVTIGIQTVAVAGCGDGQVEGLEQCDDGNVLNGDGCSFNCTQEVGWTCTGNINSTCSPICGDGIIRGNEQCDDNNTLSGDGCSTTCQEDAGWYCSVLLLPSVCITQCGDGVKAGTEMCDDNGTAPLDGCSSTCTIDAGWNCTLTPELLSICLPICGDGMIIILREECDDNNTVSNDGCAWNCTKEIGWSCTVPLIPPRPSVCSTVCGDGYVRGNEDCDDKNSRPNDGCFECDIEAGWNCTEVDSFSRSLCWPICGDGVIKTGEQCDDGNLDDDDGCSTNCTQERGWYCGLEPSVCDQKCGDEIVTKSEECDDGNTANGDLDGCFNCTVYPGWNCSRILGERSECVTICGDGIISTLEECDDNNTVASDGCFDCKVEPGWRCEGAPSVCAQIPPANNVRTGSTSTGTIVAIIVPIVISLFIIGAVIILILLKSKNKRKKLKKPDFKDVAFGSDGTAAVTEVITPEKRRVLQSLEELLLQPDMYFVSALCDVTQATEVDKVAKALVYLFYNNNKTLDLLKFRVTREIEQAESENTLFRANSFASKMFTIYSKIIGLDYLWETLGLIMFELNEIASGNANQTNVKASEGQKSLLGHTSIEVDPNKMGAEEDSVANQLQLQLFAHKIWKAVIDSEMEIPSDFRDLFHHIVVEMPRKYADKSAVYKAVGGFFFLRFICPSITTPHVYALLKEPPSESVQRCVVLLSKVLQSIANGTLPGKKEQYMESMNDFISTHIKDAVNFFEKISNILPDQKIDMERFKVPENALDNSISFLHKHVGMSMNKLLAAVDGDSRGEELKPKLKNLMQEM